MKKSIIAQILAGMTLAALTAPAVHAQSAKPTKIVVADAKTTHHLNLYVAKEKGLLAIARALSVEPRIILMDEPFAAVDAQTRETLQEELLELWSGTGRTVVLVTHDIDEAVYLSDEIVVFFPQPGTVRNRLTVDTPRPRRRDDPVLADLRARILSIYRQDAEHRTDWSI
jgi:ABC-type taurine transport system ATPase subunit